MIFLIGDLTFFKSSKSSIKKSNNELPTIDRLLNLYLTELFNKYSVSVWTAASKDYALFIIKNAIIAGCQNRKLSYILEK